jgi:hypothetical protein
MIPLVDLDGSIRWSKRKGRATGQAPSAPRRGAPNAGFSGNDLRILRRPRPSPPMSSEHPERDLVPTPQVACRLTRRIGYGLRAQVPQPPGPVRYPLGQ